MIWPVNKNIESKVFVETDEYKEGYNQAIEDCKAAYEKEQPAKNYCVVCREEAVIYEFVKGWRCGRHALFGNS